MWRETRKKPSESRITLITRIKTNRPCTRIYSVTVFDLSGIEFRTRDEKVIILEEKNEPTSKRIYYLFT